MSVKWFERVMKDYQLVIRAQFDYGNIVGHPNGPRVEIQLFSAYMSDEWICGGVTYKAAFGGPGLTPTIFPLLDSWEKCWSVVQGGWKDKKGWLQHKPVVCRISHAGEDSEMDHDHLELLQHLARAQGMIMCQEGDGWEKGLYRHISDELGDFIRDQNNRWASRLRYVRT